MGVPGVKGTHSGLDWGAGVNSDHREKTDPGLFKPISFHRRILKPGNKKNCVNKDFGRLPSKLEFHLNLRGIKLYMYVVFYVLSSKYFSSLFGHLLH